MTRFHAQLVKRRKPNSAFTHTLRWDGMDCAGNSMCKHLHWNTLSYQRRLRSPSHSIPAQRVCECTITAETILHRFQSSVYCTHLIWSHLICPQYYFTHQEECEVFVCLSICLLAYLRNHTAELHQIFLLVDYGRGSILLWRCCDVLFVLPVLWMTSCFHVMAFWRRSDTRRSCMTMIMNRCYGAFIALFILSYLTSYWSSKFFVWKCRISSGFRITISCHVEFCRGL